MALGKRGYEVVLAEAGRELGGRVLREARLPGLAAWIRVVDYRRGQLAKLPNVELALESEVTADEVRGYGFDHVAVATGARWRADGVGRWHTRPPGFRPGCRDADARRPHGWTATRRRADRPLRRRPLLPRRRARRVAGDRGQARHARHTGAARLGVEREHDGARADPPPARRGRRRARDRAGPRSGRRRRRRASSTSTRAASASCLLDGLVLVTARLPNDALAFELGATAIGDAYAPGTIATAVWDGRRYAEELDGDAARRHSPVPPRGGRARAARMEVSA